ncbi:trypsin CFT-1-like isoform X1 [Maniola jurtina]|uniref:trypsin CFT-1-like isoform X1 n=1 Tax=Maniola jurtina TaxID=191418 RepID=UPI001E68A94F|nr:trypsin CFT-1-like isoform X1 [Maniola jurtina]
MQKFSILALLTLAGSLNGASLPAMRIMGGVVTTINSYPFVTSLLRSSDFVNYVQTCAGSILTNKAILSAGHCFAGEQPSRWRIRTGSSWANSRGTVYSINQIILHPYYNSRTYDSDIAILKSASSIALVGPVAVGSIAGANYKLADNQPVWAVGWGATYFGGPKSEQLRRVQIWAINQNVCRSRYAELGRTVTNNMLCSGWIDVGGRDQCQDDAGGPLLHNNVIVGVASWGHQCGLARYPGVNTRVSNFTSWISSNAA